MPNQQLPNEVSERPWLTWIIIAGSAIIVVAVVVALVARSDRQGTPDTSETTSTANVAIPELPSTFSQIPDQDRDRLTDNQEKELGTDPTKPDSDGDGLSDYDEVAIYKTDPNKSDTDGDGFTDGAEVQRGFNPAGEGELLNINRALEQQAPAP